MEFFNNKSHSVDHRGMPAASDYNEASAAEAPGDSLQQNTGYGAPTPINHPDGQDHLTCLSGFRTPTKREISLALLQGCVEWNPGPPKVCKHCSTKLPNHKALMSHLSAAHPKQGDKGGQSGGHDSGAMSQKELLEQLKDLTAKLKGVEDAGKDHLREAKDLKADLENPAAELKRAIELHNLTSDYDSLLNSQKTPDFQGAVPQDSGDIYSDGRGVAIRVQPPSNLGRSYDFVVPGDSRPSVCIGELRQDQYPDTMMSTSPYERKFRLLGFWLFWQCCFGFLVSAINGEPFRQGVQYSSLTEQSPIRSPVLIFFYPLFWLFSAMQPLIQIADWIMLGPFFHHLIGWHHLLSLVTRGSYTDSVFFVVNSLTVGVVTLIVVSNFLNWFLQMVYLVAKFMAPRLFFMLRIRFFRELAAGPPTLTEFMLRPLEKIKHIRLVMIKADEPFEDDFDARPEMDRNTRFAKQTFATYRVLVEVRTEFGFRYYKDWVEQLPLQWYKSSGRTFKQVTLNDGLLATALNRKTLLAARGRPEVAIDAMTRLIQANPHYQECYMGLLSDGSSIYRDMALVCGAIVSRDPYHDNAHF